MNINSFLVGGFHHLETYESQSEGLYIHIAENKSHVQNHIWLVVSTPLKNISQMGVLFPIYGKIKNVSNHQPDMLWKKNV